MGRCEDSELHYAFYLGKTFALFAWVFRLHDGKQTSFPSTLVMEE